MQTTLPGQTGSPVPMPGLEIGTVLMRATLHAMSEWNREMARFVGHRLEMDARLQDELARCDDPLNAFETMTRFVQTACDDYSSELRRFQELCASTLDENCATLEAGATTHPAPAIE